MNVIELNTHRLLLRQWIRNDFSKFAEMNSNDNVMRYLPDKLSETESNALAERISKQISERGWGLWALEEKSTNEFIGFTGLNPTPSELIFSPAIEIGWRLLDKKWGKGYATEAAKEVLRFAFENLQLGEVVSFTTVTNTKSLAVMRRIGMVNTGSNFMHPLVPENHPLKEHILYKINKSQWQKNDC
jgi:ribosomal-protein-alanine N-acetyltransferase